MIGNGNVAADVTRILIRSHDELARTDIADHALEALRESAIEEVVVLGRRGPAQAAFTSAELRELGQHRGRRPARRPGRGRARPGLARVARRGGHVHRAQERASCCASSRPGRPTGRARAGSCCASCAPRSRSAATAASRRSTSAATRSRAATTARCAPARSTSRSRRSSAGSSCARSATARCRCPTCPFDERHFVLPNERGRVLTPDGEPLPGVYAVGWIKRGPTGILGTNKRDAEETVAAPGGGPARRAAGAAERGRERDRRAARRAPAGPRHGRRLARDRRRRSASRAAPPSARA